MKLPLQKGRQQRIFISYRREDAQWAAARLADALADYFGEARVFRDIEGIAGGSDFGAVIKHTLTGADAVIVLIGKRWLGAQDEGGQRRLENPEDWVAREVIDALESGVPIYPVLIDDVSMPRREELPEGIKSLARYHAVSISDQNWSRDIDQLAKIIALDIPSATERSLHTVNLLVSTVLFLALAFTAMLLTWNSVEHEVSSGGILSKHDYTWSELYPRILHGSKAGARQPAGPDTPCDPPRLKLLELWQSGIIFLAIVPSSALLFVFAPMVDRSRRRYFLAAAWVGAVGSFATFVLFYFIAGEFESIVIFGMAMIVAPLMFALMCLSGFKAR